MVMGHWRTRFSAAPSLRKVKFSLLKTRRSDYVIWPWMLQSQQILGRELWKVIYVSVCREEVNWWQSVSRTLTWWTDTQQLQVWFQCPNVQNSFGKPGACGQVLWRWWWWAWWLCASRIQVTWLRTNKTVTLRIPSNVTGNLCCPRHWSGMI